MKASLSPQVRKRVECLRHLQSQHDELEAEFLEERNELEARYQKLYQPLYTKRYEIVNGIKDVEGPTSNQLAEIKEDPVTEEKGVPEFWLSAMKTHEVLAEEIKERDEGALKFIKDIKWSRLHDPKGFKLEFCFNPNPYFKNSVLTKSYHIIDESDLVLDQAIGTEIEWFPGKCLTKKVVKKKPRMWSRNTKPVTTIEDCESFFTFFDPPQIPENEDGLDDDAYDELQGQLQQDYSVGTIIRDKIIPNAVSWFTGEAIEDDASDGIDDDTEDESEDDEEEGGGDGGNYDSNEDEEEEERKRSVKKEVDEDDDEDEEEEDEEKVSGKKKIGELPIREGHWELPSQCKSQ
ncbi:unnamed protein product [Dovyalis caffra]|uniref:Uncharacterized protein n=1 Tax=Dovyalis caffra TaxID=77055 RepID=A0AAV1SVL2_9ROSI|nr:unnamed protein product [Dovyalis caffra]